MLGALRGRKPALFTLIYQVCAGLKKVSYLINERRKSCFLVSIIRSDIPEFLNKNVLYIYLSFFSSPLYVQAKGSTAHVDSNVPGSCALKKG